MSIDESCQTLCSLSCITHNSYYGGEEAINDSDVLGSFGDKHVKHEDKKRAHELFKHVLKKIGMKLTDFSQISFVKNEQQFQKL